MDWGGLDRAGRKEGRRGERDWDWELGIGNLGDWIWDTVGIWNGMGGNHVTGMGMCGFGIARRNDWEMSILRLTEDWLGIGWCLVSVAPRNGTELNRTIARFSTAPCMPY